MARCRECGFDDSPLSTQLARHIKRAESMRARGYMAANVAAWDEYLAAKREAHAALLRAEAAWWKILPKSWQPAAAPLADDGGKGTR